MLEKLKDLFRENKEVKVLDKSILKLSLRELIEQETISECKDLAVVESKRFTPLPTEEYRRELENGTLYCFHAAIDKSTMICEAPIEIPLEASELKEILHIQSLINGKDLSAEISRFEWHQRGDT